MRGLGPRPWVYFVHSFAPPVGPETTAVCDYGGDVAALAAKRSLVGCAVPPGEVGRDRPGAAGQLRARRTRGGVMELLPAIDLRAGAAVRLTQGDFGREDRYGDPVALAASYVAGGARWIHVVDLDGARTGVAHERDALGRIVGLAGAAGVSVEFGGGIRSEDDAAEVLDSGVTRVVLGTAALEEPALAGRCARRWPGRVAVGLDYRVGADGVAEAQAQGWLAGSGRAVTDLLGNCGRRSPSAPSWPRRWPRRHAGGPRPRGAAGPPGRDHLARRRLGGRVEHRRPRWRWRASRPRDAGCPVPLWARRSWKGGSPSRRGVAACAAFA